VKPLELELLRQNTEFTARVAELVAQNKALLARIAELGDGKPPMTPDNSSLPPSRGQKGNVAEPTRAKKTRKGRPGAARAAPRSLRQVRSSRGPGTMSICRRSSRSQHGSICSALRARITAQAPADMPEGSPRSAPA
jgi:hypothetical protein